MRELGEAYASSGTVDASGSVRSGHARRRRPSLVYDGGRSFRASSVRAAQHYLKPSVEVLSYQRSQLTGAALERAKDEVLLTRPDRERGRGGADAAAMLLFASSRRWAWPSGWLLRLSGARAVGAAIYRLVSGTRTCPVGPA